MADQKTVEKVKAMLEGHVYAPLKEAAEKWLEAADPALEKIAETELVKQLKEGVTSISEALDFFKSDKAVEIIGSKEAVEQLKAHVEAQKAEGKQYCDCPACVKAREILRDLGEDIGE